MSRVERYTKIGVALCAAIYAGFYAATVPQWHFIDNVDLIIHEAGHLLFSLFPQFIYIAMGSGFQILLPAVFVWHFFRNHAPYSASITMYWVGFNILNVSVYAADAQKMQLPLLGGDIHDWNWMLSTLHILPYATYVATAMYLFGLVVLGVACLSSFTFIEHD